MTMIFRFVLILCMTASATLRADFGDQSFGWSSVESEYFRDYAVRSLNRQDQLINDYWLNYWLEQSFLSLNLASDAPIGPTQVLLINDDSINAFAMPGNIIGMHAGLWLNTRSEAELISVLAHEMGHISLDHFSRLTQSSNRQTLTLASGILLSILLSGQNPEAANAALISSFALSNQNQLTFSRAMETEADQLAQQILSRAGFDPEAGRSFFQRLDQFSSQSNQLEFLRTHPLGSTRSSDLGTRSRNPDATEPASPVFDILTLRLRTGLSDTEKSTLIQRRMADLTEETIHADPNLRLMQAELKYQQHGDPARYQKDLNEILALFPAFLPANFTALEQALPNPDEIQCQQFGSTLKLTNNQNLSLDALQILNSTSRACDHISQTQLHARQLWQSGKEERALQFLKQRLKTTTSAAQSALLNSLLELYSRRYARFN